ncbi:C-terminal binding protein [Breoghania sp.]|uniref:C-terminal binding protein n=1 Tax=Breoghania sp. TaxID=2065378 RepID=UPI0029CAA351|nr:C-terminal binding protein [Breoghania sp.]
MKVVYSDLNHSSHAIEDEILAAAGLSAPLYTCLTEDEVIDQLGEAEIVLNQYAPFTARVFEALPNLKQIIRYGVGYNNVDLEAATKAGVQVCNVPDYGMNEVADHALALSLTLLRKIVPMNNSCQAGRWDYIEAVPIRRLRELTVGVIGLGRIGQVYARKMNAIDLKVLGYDKFYKPNAADGTDYIESADTDRIFKEADIVAVFCPLTDETRNMINADVMASMKDTAVIVNTSRGGIVNEADLAAALKAGQIAGAGIDTTGNEPLEDGSPLRGIETCLITPHMAWYSEDSANELKRKVAEEAVRFAQNQPVNWPVNKL